MCPHAPGRSACLGGSVTVSCEHLSGRGSKRAYTETSQCSTRDQPWPLCSPMVHPRSGTLPHPRNHRGEHRGRRLCSPVNIGAVSHTRPHRVVAAITRRCNLRVCYLARSCMPGHPGRGAGPAGWHNTKCGCMRALLMNTESFGVRAFRPAAGLVFTADRNRAP